MNKNPLLIKNFLTGNIPFMKGKTLSLYKKYLSENKFKKAFNKGNQTETISAYTMNSTYDIDFIFDQADISPVTYFSEKEWIFLGLALRAYKEVEGIDLMHLYNCFYKGDSDKLKGKVVVGRIYTLYSFTQLPVTIRISIGGEELSLVRSSLSAHHPLIFYITENGLIDLSSKLKNKKEEFTRSSTEYISESNLLEEIVYEEKEKSGENYEALVDIEMEFTGIKYQRATLVEGYGYSGFNFLNIANSNGVIPELLKEGEYSSKLVEFFAGTLITKKSDPKLISSVNYGFRSNGIDLWDKAKKDTPGIFNKDGFVDRRVNV